MIAKKLLICTDQQYSTRLLKFGLAGLCTLSTIGLNSPASQAESSQTKTQVVTERSADTADFGFQNIPSPALNDSAQSATWSVLRGTASANGGALQALADGKVPSSDDSPSENFFFDNNTQQGLLLVDLGSVQELSEIAVYSWHPAERAAQVYNLYASESLPDKFQSKNAANSELPDLLIGWTKIAAVDTHEKSTDRRRFDSPQGGQHASRIHNPEGSIGKYQYLLFDIAPSEADHPFGRTFFSEIDIITTADLKKPLSRLESLPRRSFTFATDDSKYQFTIDTTVAPHLDDWARDKLQPVVKTWYPKIVDMLPSDNFTAPDKVTLRFLPNAKMNGIPAYAQNNRITMNAEWYSRELKREAIGATVHELVHVVQQYNARRSRTRNSSQPTPGWITEGIPDYIRWFLYEPETGGALLSPAALAKAKHSDSYRTSANFIDFVVRTHDAKGTLIRDLNAAAREGRYSAAVWQSLTGMSLEELEKSWKEEKEKK